jgi:hypothetical protein
MNKILAAREKIYDHIQNFAGCGWRTTCTPDEFEVYCIAKDTIQDTAETLLAHRERGFVPDVYRRYVEYYGILQAIYIQQDAIDALFKLFMASRVLDFSLLPKWQFLRELRNDTVGHPVGRRKRLNRNIIGYDRVNFMSCPGNEMHSWKSTDVNLACVLEAYEGEAAGVLESVADELASVCRTKHTQQGCGHVP